MKLHSKQQSSGSDPSSPKRIIVSGAPINSNPDKIFTPLMALDQDQAAAAGDLLNTYHNHHQGRKQSLTNFVLCTANVHL
jgi:hypothetical protein